MRTPYKLSKPTFDIQQIVKNIFQDQQKRALVVRKLRIERGYAYQFIADECEQRWINGMAGWPTRHWPIKHYWIIGEAICREAAKQLGEPFEYPWSDG